VETKLIVFFRKKMINDHGWLFEQLIDSLNLASNYNSEENENNEQKNNTGSASKAKTCDRYFVSYYKTQKAYRQFKLKVYLKYKVENSSHFAICMDFQFNRLRDVKKVDWKNESPWYCEV